MLVFGESRPVAAADNAPYVAPYNVIRWFEK